jgi:hypothetical protein
MHILAGDDALNAIQTEIVASGGLRIAAKRDFLP